MNKQQFLTFWAKNYPETKPINNLFLGSLKATWFRIHSLPASKRYANNDAEYDIIMQRYNALIDDLVPQNDVVTVVINYIEIDNPLFKKYDFTNLGVFVDNEGETVYQSFMFQHKWHSHSLDELLTYIADDQMRAFIVAKEVLISPYDGGMDLYIKEISLKDTLKLKYTDWLSKREDGY